MLHTIPSTAAAILLVVAASLPDFASEGTWTATTKEAARLQLTLQWNSSTWGRSIPRAEFRGISDHEIASPTTTAVSFRIEREAGTFEFEGFFREGRGAGHFRFQPNRGFGATLRSLGVESADAVSDRDLMILAYTGMSSAAIREFTRLGFASLTLKNVVELAVHDVTPDYVRAIHSLGFTDVRTAASAVEMKIHRLTPEYVRELEALGYRGLARPQLLQMGIHGVTGDVIRELGEVGYRNLSPEQLVKLRIHGVGPDYIREMREAGFRDLSPEALAELRIHRVSLQYIRELAAVGYRDLSRQQLLQMGIHGVTPAFIREMRDAGYADLAPETLVKMKIHGIDSTFMRSVSRRGS